MAAGVGHHQRHRVRPRRGIAVLGGRGRRLRGDRGTAVAEVEPVAGDRRGIPIGRARPVRLDGERRARELAHRQSRGRRGVGRDNRPVAGDPRHPRATARARGCVLAGRARDLIRGSEMVATEGEGGQRVPTRRPTGSAPGLVPHRTEQQLDRLRGRRRGARTEAGARSRRRRGHVPGCEARELVDADQVRNRQREVHGDGRTGGERTHIGGREHRGVPQGEPVTLIDVQPIRVAGRVAGADRADRGRAQLERDQQGVPGDHRSARGQGHLGCGQEGRVAGPRDATDVGGCRHGLAGAGHEPCEREQGGSPPPHGRGRPRGSRPRFARRHSTPRAREVRAASRQRAIDPACESHE